MSEVPSSQLEQSDRADSAGESSETTELTPPQGSNRENQLWRLAVVVLGCTILLQGVLALFNGWVASGDDGYWALMARSVFSTHPPMVGSSSSGGLHSSVPYYHLGPLGFYLLAPFVRIFGGAGLAVGVAVINAVAVVVGAVAVRRSVGVRSGWLVLTGGALLQFAMGSEVLVDSWNPNFAVLPLWCSISIAWAVIRGGRNWAAAGIFAASLALQTHLSFAPVAGVTALVILIAAVYHCVVPGPAAGSDTTTDDVLDQAVRPWTRWRPVIWAVGAGLVANLIPMVQQLFGPGPPNISTALSGSASQDAVMGFRTAWWAVYYFFLPTRFLPGDWRRDPIPTSNLEGWALGGVGAIVLAALVVLAVTSWRSKRYQQLAVLAFGVLLIMAAVFVASRTSTTVFDFPFVRMSLFRWAWPLALFVMLIMIDTAWCLFGSHPRALVVKRDWFYGASALLVIMLSLANLPGRDEGSGAVPIQREAVTSVISEAGPLIAQRGRPLIKVDWYTSSVATPALMDWLDQRGHGFGLDDETALRQAGSRFKPNGSETFTVVIRYGEAAIEEPPEGFERLSNWSPLSKADEQWFLTKRDVVEKRLIDLADKVDNDPELWPLIRPSGSNGRDLREPWFDLLCSEFDALPRDSEYLQKHVVSTGDRSRLCQLGTSLRTPALAVDVGPAPS
ncbi:MAG: hypothetical protein KDB26_12050 [Microthrixaceae bacterium]|nr:hypothetical protein [Microthrixaceae bacterium]